MSALRESITRRVGARRRPALFYGSLILVDAVVMTLAFLCAHYASAAIPLFHQNPNFRETTIGQNIPILPVLIVTAILAFSHVRLYDLRRKWDYGEVAFSVAVGVSLAMGLVIGFSYMTKQFGFSRLLLIYLWITAAVFTFASRCVLYRILVWLRRKGVGLRRVLIAGLSESGLMLERQFAQCPELGYEVIGFLAETQTGEKESTNAFSAPDAVRVLGTTDELYEIAKAQGASGVILTGRALASGELLPVIATLFAEGIEVKAIPDLFETAPRHMGFTTVGNVPVIFFRDQPLVTWEAFAKRSIDLVGSLLGLILLAPLFLVIAILIKLGSPGPVFFAQERSGQDGKPFRMYKFRSMVASAANAPPVKVTADDRRVTRIGAFIRRTSIDELPQLFNVLKGEMSLVGPRPETFLYVNQYSGWNRRRLYLRPGITGLAQAYGVRGNTSIDEKTKYDLEYMEKQSVWLDLKILIRTVVTFFKHREAY